MCSSSIIHFVRSIYIFVHISTQFYVHKADLPHISQDRDDAFNGHRHRKSSNVFDICIFFKCMYIYNTIIGIILLLHQITKKK